MNFNVNPIYLKKIGKKILIRNIYLRASASSKLMIALIFYKYNQLREIKVTTFEG